LTSFREVQNDVIELASFWRSQITNTHAVVRISHGELCGGERCPCLSQLHEFALPKGDHMTRIIIALFAAFGMALPALADRAVDNSAAGGGNAAAASSQLTEAANAQQARAQLAHQGYSNISELRRDDQGRWSGTAVKDGKTVFVAIALPNGPQGHPAN
jgi:hypothetical protein